MPVRRSAIEEDEEPIINIDHSIESSLSSSISKPSCFLFFAAFVALLNAVSFGLVAGYYSASIESMRNSSFNHVDWDEDKSSWIAAAQPIGALVGGLVGGPFMSLVGPKKALIYSNVPYATGWALIVFGVQFVDIMVGRTLGGFAVGLSCGIVPCYCVEISTQEIRGLLGMFFQLFVNGGIFIAWSAGKWLDYRWLGSMSGGVAILMPLLMIWCPESPVYLAKGGFPNRDKVLKSLRSLRNNNSSVELEYELLADSASSSNDGSTMCSNIGKFFRLPHFYKPLLLAFAIMFFQQFCGINAVIIYQMDIFEQSGSTLDPHTCSIITGGVLFMATLVGSLIVDKFGRKLLLVISGIGMALALVPLAYYFQVIDHETPEAAAQTSAEYGWVALMSLVLFLASFNIALGPIPWMMVPEITPSAARSSVAALATCFSWSLAFIFIKWFPLLEQIAGKSVVFYTFATISLLSCIFTCFLLPETKGKSLHELEQLFIPQNILSDNSFDSN